MSRHWHVVLDSGTSLDIGPWKAGMKWGGNVEAPDRDAAIAAAREQCRPTMGDTYADGRVESVEELSLWKLTLRGRHDKRRRETFTTRAVTEREARRNVGYMRAAYLFAGPGIDRPRTRKGKDGVLRQLPDPVVKVERDPA